MTELNTEQLQELVIHTLDEMKAERVNHINVEGVSGFTDRMIFASGNSTRHVKSLAQSVVEKVKESGQTVMGLEGEDVGDWVLIDLGEIVVHVMIQDTRDFYDIERLWTDQLGDRADTES